MKEQVLTIEMDLRPGSDYRKKATATVKAQYGVVSFPRSGHNWLARMIAEIVKTHNMHDDTSAAVGMRGGMGAYLGLKCQRPSQVAKLVEFFEPFPVLYGSHGSASHDGYDPSTRVYLYRKFWPVWKSTKKALKEMAEIQEAKTGVKNLRAGMWWGKNVVECFAAYCNHRWRFRHAPLKIRYEDLQRDPFGVLRTIVDDMGVWDVKDTTIHQAVRAGSRENMLHEQELYGSPNGFQTVNPSI